MNKLVALLMALVMVLGLVPAVAEEAAAEAATAYIMYANADWSAQYWHDGNEYAVSICAKDAAAPYDYELTNRLIGYAEKAGCDYEVDIYYHYGTDANAAVRAGNNLRAATFGMAVWCSHGMERTHISGLLNTTNLLLGYVLDI